MISCTITGKYIKPILRINAKRPGLPYSTKNEPYPSMVKKAFARFKTKKTLAAIKNTRGGMSPAPFILFV